VRPTDLKSDGAVKIKVLKRGQPQTNIFKLTPNEGILDEPLKPENAI